MSDRGDELDRDFVGCQPQRRNSGKRAAAARSTGLRHPLHQPRFGAILRNALQMLNNRNTWHPERFATLRKSMQFVRLELEIRCSIQLNYGEDISRSCNDLLMAGNRGLVALVTCVINAMRVPPSQSQKSTPAAGRSFRDTTLHTQSGCPGPLHW